MSEKSEPKAKEEKEVEKSEEITPQWAVKLGAQFEKMADSFNNLAESYKASVAKQEEEEEEEPPKEEEKQEEEEEEEPPKEEEKQEEEEEEEPPKEEEKVDEKKINEAIELAVTKAIEKRFATLPEKKSKVPKDIENVLDYDAISKMSWGDVNAEAQKRGAR